MQEGYLGDSHDFVKYALLRFLHRALGVTIGVNWYLTKPHEVDKPGNNDGEKRHHMNGGEWENWDPDLFDCLRHFQNPENRRIDLIENQGVLPKDTKFYCEHVPIDDRDNWHQRAKIVLKDADLIFLDPDNGFEVTSMSRQKAPKYALYDEALDYHRNGKTVIGIQFAKRQSRELQIQQIRARLGKTADGIPVLRGRTGPNILFFTLAQPYLVSKLKEALTDFAESSPPMSRHQTDRRVELIP